MALTTPSAAGAQTPGHHGRVSVVASNLNNPRGLAPAPGGGLYLAEAGSGGSSCVDGGEQGTACLGLTGSFDLVTGHSVKRLVTGLISGSGAGGVAGPRPWTSWVTWSRCTRSAGSVTSPTWATRTTPGP
jgi:hypothetical protein